MVWWHDDKVTRYEMIWWFDDVIWWYEGVGCDLHTDEAVVPRLQYRGHRCQPWMILACFITETTINQCQNLRLESMFTLQRDFSYWCLVLLVFTISTVYTVLQVLQVLLAHLRVDFRAFLSLLILSRLNWTDWLSQISLWGNSYFPCRWDGGWVGLESASRDIGIADKQQCVHFNPATTAAHLLLFLLLNAYVQEGCAKIFFVKVVLPLFTWIWHFQSQH